MNCRTPGDIFMPSFDAVSEINLQEADNAVNQAKKEIGQRFDFKGTKTTIALEKNLLKIVSDDEYKMNAVLDIIRAKMSKRGVDLKSLDVGKIEPAHGSLVKCEVKLIEGIDADNAKKITKAIKESKLKVQAQIQDNQVRVTGKKRDDLQEAMAMIRALDVAVPIQFKNFRD